MIRSYLWVGLGGGIGAVLRYSLSLIIPSQTFPWSFFVINLSGSLVIGVVMTLVIDYAILSQDARLFIAVGILGGYTTFSTFTYGLYHLLLQNLVGRSILYGAGSILGGLLATVLGMSLARAWIEWRQSESEDPDET